MSVRYFIPATTLAEWHKRLNIVEFVFSAAESVFSDAWKNESVWQWLNDLREEMSGFDFSQTVSDKRDAFFLAMLEQIDWNAVTALGDKMDEVAVAIESGQRGVVGRPINIEPWKVLGARIDLTSQGVELMSAKIFNRADMVQLTIGKQLEAVAKMYEDFKLEFRLVAAALLYYSPSGGPVDIFKLEKESEVPVTDWAPVFRILGQAIHSHDGDVLAWAGKFLYVSATRVDKSMFENEPDRILFVILLHLSLGNFSELNEWRQARGVEWYVWEAMCFGVLIEKELQEFLAGRPILTDYIIHSGGFSELLHYSAQLIYASEDQITVGGFIKGFLSFTKGDGRDTVEQDLYINQAIAEHKWPSDLKYLLQKLLSLYIHLRDCDFIDYRGMLTEEQIILDKYDWKKIVRQGISDKDMEEFKEYFRMTDRPALIKVKLINAFESVPWESEPYLSRVAQLSELYAEVFPSFDYSPIIYFDEVDGKIKFNKQLPDSWYSPWFKFGIEESVWRQAEEEAKKKFQNLFGVEDIEFN